MEDIHLKDEIEQINKEKEQMKDEEEEEQNGKDTPRVQKNSWERTTEIGPRKEKNLPLYTITLSCVKNTYWLMSTLTHVSHGSIRD